MITLMCKVFEQFVYVRVISENIRAIRVSGDFENDIPMMFLGCSRVAATLLSHHFHLVRTLPLRCCYVVPESFLRCSYVASGPL